jgi:hypothetical protein
MVRHLLPTDGMKYASSSAANMSFSIAGDTLRYDVRRFLKIAE